MRDEKPHDLNALLWRSDQISNQEGVVMASPGVAGSHHPRLYEPRPFHIPSSPSTNSKTA